MTNSAAGGPLTPEQAQELNGLKNIWARFYVISCDGVRWSAVPAGEERVLHAESRDQMRAVLMADSRAWLARRGCYVETASGPPYFVEFAHASGRDLRDR